MNEQMRTDLMILRGMAMTNVAALGFEEYMKRNAEYHAHKQDCIAKYGIAAVVRAESYGVQSTA